MLLLMILPQKASVGLCVYLFRRTIFGQMLPLKSIGLQGAGGMAEIDQVPRERTRHIPLSCNPLTFTDGSGHMGLGI